MKNTRGIILVSISSLFILFPIFTLRAYLYKSTRMTDPYFDISVGLVAGIGMLLISIAYFFYPSMKMDRVVKYVYILGLIAYFVVILHRLFTEGIYT